MRCRYLGTPDRGDQASIRSERWRGRLLWWFLAVYGAGRALAELFRPPEELRRLIGPLSASQWACLTAALTAGIILAVHRRPEPIEAADNAPHAESGSTTDPG